MARCLALLAGLAATAWGGAPPWLAGEPEGALIRFLEPHRAPDAPPGLALSRRERWLPELRLSLIQATATSQGQAAVRPGRVPLAAWTFRVAEGRDAARYRPLTYRDDTWYGSTYWTGPDWTRVGRDWHHPGIHTPSVRRFSAPRDGTVSVTGRVFKAHLDGDGVRALIRHNARTIWTTELEGKDAKGAEPRLTLRVRRGDAIRFIVHKRGRIFCDTTRWNPVVAYEDEERSVAAEGFSRRRQGESGWSYEMEADSRTGPGLPTVHFLGTDLFLRTETAGAGRTVTLSHADALPLAVLADGADRSGVVVALDSTGPWELRCTMTDEGRLHVALDAGETVVEPGKPAPLPRVAFGPYRGRRMAGVATLQRLLASGTDVGALRSRVAGAFRSTLGADPPPELDLWAMVQADWLRQDAPVDAASFAAAAARHLERGRQLAQRLGIPSPERLEAPGADLPEAEHRRLYLRTRWLKRQIALANPRLRFGALLFTKRVPTSYSHLVMQYYGWRARPGGGIFILERPGHSLAVRRIFDASEGNVLEPRLSYDARRVVFSYVHCPDGPLDPGPLLNDRDEGFYHIWEIGVDGTGARQLTRGPYDDLMPAPLPDGGIVFCSTRRRGYARCFGGQFSRRWHVYTLHRCDADGGSIRTLSFHDTNEWFPAVANSGHILFSRWDYVDRDAVTHQNLWAARPDGTNPVALWGNATPKPHCTFQIQPIPNSTKLVFTASAHHSITAGPICTVDPALGDNGQVPITRITPEIPFPEAESRDIREYYAAPWPLSEDDFLVAYSPTPLAWEPRANDRAALGIALLDRFGNRELLYRDPEIGSTNPVPLAPRARPPIVTPLPTNREPTGEMLLIDVYEGLGDVPRGTVTALRIVQIFPKTTHVANSPPIGLAREENARAVLGTVPVHADGSARFLVPAGKPLAFQALDRRGFAYQTMHSATYVQPGERTSCVGCHESRRTAPPNTLPLALRRPPSAIRPGPFDGAPFSYVRVVQPVLDKHCTRCHGGAKPKKGIDLTGAPHKGFTRSYWSLCGDRDFWGGGTNPKNAAEALVPRMGGRNPIQRTPPGGMYGARGSRLLKMLAKGHNDVKLSPAELARLALWIDCNAVFHGAYDAADQARQLRGEPLPMPKIQ